MVNSPVDCSQPVYAPERARIRLREAQGGYIQSEQRNGAPDAPPDMAPLGLERLEAHATLLGEVGPKGCLFGSLLAPSVFLRGRVAPSTSSIGNPCPQGNPWPGLLRACVAC